jgi:hypothetical protein
MKTWSIGAVLTLSLVVTACPRDDQREVAPDTAALAPHRDPGAVPAAAQTIELAPLPGGDVSGQANFIPVGAQSQISIHVHQAPPNTSVTAHVVTGSCQQPGPTAADLQPVVTDAAGMGTSEMVVNIRPEIIINGNHVVQLRRANGREGIPVACGEIPAHPVLHDQP